MYSSFQIAELIIGRLNIILESQTPRIEPISLPAGIDRGESDRPSNGPNKQKTVYIAHCPAVREPDRARLVKTFRMAGWNVVPHGDYREEEFDRRMAADLDLASVFVQLLETAPWPQGLAQYKATFSKGINVS